MLFIRFIRLGSILIVLNCFFILAIDRSVKNYFQSFQNYRPDWLSIIGSTVSFLECAKETICTVDLTAGAASISSKPILANENLSNGAILFTGHESESMLKILDLPLSPQLRVHRLGMSVLKRLPDTALLGFLTLIASELVQREVAQRSPLLPPIFQDLANTTSENLDLKLQKLTSLSWAIEPFIQDELLDLQLQPLEVIDKFISKELLPRVDRDISPLLSKLLTDPSKVTVITQNIKDLIQLAAFVVFRPTGGTSTPIETKTMRQIIQQVDLVGSGVEEVMRDWNKLLQDLGKLIKAESIIALIPESILPMGMSRLALARVTSVALKNIDPSSQKRDSGTELLPSLSSIADASGNGTSPSSNLSYQYPRTLAPGYTPWRPISWYRKKS